MTFLYSMYFCNTLNLLLFVFSLAFSFARENRVLMDDLNMSLYSRASRVHFYPSLYRKSKTYDLWNTHKVLTNESERNE